MNIKDILDTLGNPHLGKTDIPLLEAADEFMEKVGSLPVELCTNSGLTIVVEDENFAQVKAGNREVVIFKANPKP